MSRGLEGNWAQPQDTWVIQQESGSSMVRSGDYPPIGRLFGLGGPQRPEILEEAGRMGQTQRGRAL